MPATDTECFQIFLDALAKRLARQYILLFVDGAGNHGAVKSCDPRKYQAGLPVSLLAGAQPAGKSVRRDSREKFHYTRKSIDEVYDKLEEAALYLERNPELVKSITSFPYIANSF